ncbi:hypothetical protein EZV62_025767 [Acer yangbiense]|uniref:Kinesin motor domain-containing protein n=1 Tax=Acer yangbiense TaxID=1000413 RepID=A0A5C7H097_9ROSI|nr:hypothetical protein EZV62_025767 [Acer yangbiense]
MEEMKSPPLTCPKTVTVRRNPHWKASPMPSTAFPQIPTSPSKNLQEISSFPSDEILSIQIPQNPQPDLSQASSTSKNLNVFLRIRPLVLVKSGDQNPKPRAKNVWPKNPAKRVAVKEKSAKDKCSKACIIVDDSQSVTLSPPLALQTSKRIRSEVYQGFSYVFSADSSQVEVYEKMLSPLVEEFMRGKTGMLAALGPSGSGKTHTIFGSIRDPGMVPRALQRIFKGTTSIDSESRRSFYLSIFEIYSVHGKGERMSDLSLHGGDLFMQQGTVKGLQEVIISDAAEAELLISCAMLRRATAMTNANSQSSRSQCIINIRSTASKLDGNNVPVKDAVLTIVDLAGAGREKRTGNQLRSGIGCKIMNVELRSQGLGSRLLESNFINNTSMIFGLCLRVCRLNSVISIPGQLAVLLMIISFIAYLLFSKEENDTGMQLPKLGYSIKVLQLKYSYILTVKSGEEDYLDTSYVLKQASPYMKIKFDHVEDPSNLVSNKRQFHMPRVEQPKRMKSSFLEPDAVDLAKKERNHRITRNFAKAIWNVLKDYKEKLKAAESEMEILRDKLSSEKMRNHELEKQLKIYVDIDSPNAKKSEINGTIENYDFTPSQDQDLFSQGNRNGKRVAANEGKITQGTMSSCASRTLYVGNLPWDICEREVEDLFYKYGPIADIDLKIPPRPPCYAFIEFEEAWDAEDAIRGRDGYDFDGHRLLVELAHVGRRSEYRVLVSGLPSSASWQDLKDHMRPAGNVCFSQVFRDGSGTTGIVDYTSYGDMKHAIKKLNDSEFQNAFSQSYVRVREYDHRQDHSRSPSRGSHSRGWSESCSRSHGRSYRSSRSRSRSKSPEAKSSRCSPARSRSKSVSSPSHSVHQFMPQTHAPC